MNMGRTVFVLWSILSLAVVVTFILVYRKSTSTPATVGYDVITSRRFKLLFLLSLGFICLFVAALSAVPYVSSSKPDQIISVKARMFSFQLSQDTVEVGKLIEFRVAAEDVTHGFGVYDSTGSLMGQVQAMPGYVNRLRLRFDHPGLYHIFCLEFCGPLHHQMRDSVIVR